MPRSPLTGRRAFLWAPRGCARCDESLRLLTMTMRRRSNRRLAEKTALGSELDQNVEQLRASEIPLERRTIQVDHQIQLDRRATAGLAEDLA